MAADAEVTVPAIKWLLDLRETFENPVSTRGFTQRITTGGWRSQADQTVLLFAIYGRLGEIRDLLADQHRPARK